VAKSLVTGGAGFIGSHLVTGLIERGHQVRVFDNLSTGSRKNLAHMEGRYEFVEGDLADAAQVAQAVAGVEVVFHHAALASVPMSVEKPLETHAADATGTLLLLDACRRAGVRRVVYAASSSCYGNQPDMPKTEASPLTVLSPYAAAKLAGELYCEAFAASYSLETVRLRYFNVFGPRQDPGSPYSAVIPLFVSALLEGRRPTIFGDEAPGVSGRVYNVACGASLSVLELLTMICEMMGKPFDPVFAPPRTGDVLHSWADISAARRYLRYEPVTELATGLRQTVDWFQTHYRAAN
jgi:UDP-glucose 4-epimerase